MPDILDACRNVPRRAVAPGRTLLVDGERAGVIYILVEGEVEVSKGGFQIHVISEPGAVFGEISVLLDAPHTATVTTVSDCTFHVIDDPRTFLRSHPKLALDIARLLAERLHTMTTYLVDLKKQYEGSEEHFGMVDEVLETLGHAQRSRHEIGSERDPDPNVD